MASTAPGLPGLPDEERLTSVSAYPKGLVAAMHSLLTQKGKDKMPLRVVLEARDFAAMRDTHLALLPAKQEDYKPHHWAILRLHHAVEEQRAWLEKQV